mgnify:FL=1|jgi:hypothetical protein|tara:strand:- start:46 stop:267 length:222 start_codon:yes stop_codon:yes gene_type:complete
MKLDGEKVIDQYGAVLAEYIHGEWHTKDPAVLEFIMNQDKPEKKRVRARDEKGRLKGDDPSTPNVNEAWMPES